MRVFDRWNETEELLLDIERLLESIRLPSRPRRERSDGAARPRAPGGGTLSRIVNESRVAAEDSE